MFLFRCFSLRYKGKQNIAREHLVRKVLEQVDVPGLDAQLRLVDARAVGGVLTQIGQRGGGARLHVRGGLRMLVDPQQ